MTSVWPTSHFGKCQMVTSLQQIIWSTSCLALAWGFRGWQIKKPYFWLDQIQDGGWQPLKKFQVAMSQQCVIPSTSCFILGWGFWGRQIERCYFRLDQIQDGSQHSAAILKISDGHVFAMGHLIHFTILCPCVICRLWTMNHFHFYDNYCKFVVDRF